MLQLIRADLIGILTLFADYRPQLDADSLALDIRNLGRMEDRDYLFLARREKSYLFPISEVYLAESYAYLCWTAYRLFSEPKVDALYLHISHVIKRYRCTDRITGTRKGSGFRKKEPGEEQ